GGAGRYGLGADDLAEILHGATEGVHLGREGLELAGLGCRGPLPSASLELLVAAAQHAGAVAFLGDVATQQLSGADVDRVVLEDVVEDVGTVAGVEPVEAQLLHLLEVGAVGAGDPHALGEARVL